MPLNGPMGSLDKRGVPARSEDEWASVIKADLGRAVEGIISAGQHLTEAFEQLGKGGYGRMLMKVGIHEEAAKRLRRIAGNSALTKPENLSKLPVSMRTLSELARVDAPTLEGFIADGKVHIDMERREAEQLAKAKSDRKRTRTSGSRKTPVTPKTEEELRAQASLRPSPEHISKVAEKQAAEAEAEARELEANEAETTRRLEIENGELRSENAELRARIAEFEASTVALVQELARAKARIAEFEAGTVNEPAVEANVGSLRSRVFKLLLRLDSPNDNEVLVTVRKLASELKANGSDLRTLAATLEAEWEILEKAKIDQSELKDAVARYVGERTNVRFDDVWKAAKAAVPSLGKARPKEKSAASDYIIRYLRGLGFTRGWSGYTRERGQGGEVEARAAGK